jgi:hypothetical protein
LRGDLKEKAKVDWSNIASEQQLVIPFQELWKHFKQPEKLKYNKDYIAGFADVPKLTLKKLNKHSLHQDLVGKCCSTDFCKRSQFETEEIISIRKDFWLKNWDRRTEYLEDKVIDLWNSHDNSIDYKLAGKRVCQKGFIKILGCSKSTVQGIVKECREASGVFQPKV